MPRNSLSSGFVSGVLNRFSLGAAALTFAILAGGFEAFLALRASETRGFFFPPEDLNLPELNFFAT